MKKLFTFLILAFIALFSVSVFAEQGYLEAKNYSSLSTQGFLNECKRQNKNAYFNKGIYTFSTNLNVVDGVDIIGEEGTIFQAVGAQRYICDEEIVKGITIEHIIFDNMSVWCQNDSSTGWVIRQNIFLNARDVDVSMGCQPDSSGKNGGPATGYYIHNKRGSMQVLSNLFLRDSSSLGRGVATYYTTDVVIKDNFFGRLEDVEKSIVSSDTKRLKEVAVASGLVDPSIDYGYFMTGINIINSDVNAKILGNYMSFNTHITEAGYEDGSQSTKGYNRDHFVYAKAFKNLEIVGNYFKGMNKNQDGGVKCRNGEGLLIYKNVLEDSLILLYVQNDATGAILKNVDVRENIFINKDFTTRQIKIPSGDKELTKYLTVDYSILFLNYRQDSDVDSITISSNLFYSDGYANEQIRIDNRDKAYNVPTNIFIENNKNILGASARITTRNFKDQENVDVKADWNNGVEYQAPLIEEYKALDVFKLATIQEISYEISKDGKLITSASKVYVDGKPYANETLSIGNTYFLFLMNPTTTSIVVEDGVENNIPSFLCTALKVEVREKGFKIQYEMNGHGAPISMVEDTLALSDPLPIPSEIGWKFEGWFLDEDFTETAEAGKSIASNTILYAKWSRMLYHISFLSDGGSLVSSQEVLYGEQVEQPEDPVKEGYTFLGWYKDSNKTILFDFTELIQSDITLYAKWETIKYTIHFEIQGYGIQPEDLQVEGKLPLLLPNLTQEGFTFGGWYVDVSCENKVIAGSAITEDIILYAKWIEIFYTIYFADTEFDPITVKHNATIPKPNDPIKDGYVFVGWYKEKACDTPWNFEEDKVSKNTTLFPKWKIKENPVPVTYTAIFVSNGGSSVESISNIQIGTKLTKPKDPVREGYLFKGWYKDASYVELWDFEEDVVNENITLYAKWDKEPEPTFESSSNLGTILSVSISIGVGVLGLCVLAILVIKKKKS
ncbi:MAG: InlB B-repeat-containing protein [Anaeroplasmataceae bacterium]|nr:InlB B-repeat-containing protein [Anaeroplasmataceae bacterium]